MVGRMNISSEGGDIICRNNSKAIVLDTYYLTDWNAGVPAEAISTDNHDMASGKLCYQLNAGRSEERQAWFQTLNEDRYPLPDNRHRPVWYHNGSYINDSPDGIERIRNEETERIRKGIYDLSGRHISTEANSPILAPHASLKRGIYIRDGKKVLIK